MPDKNKPRKDTKFFTPSTLSNRAQDIALRVLRGLASVSCFRDSLGAVWLIPFLIQILYKVVAKVATGVTRVTGVTQGAWMPWQI